ncbi:MAG TPA: Sir2 family NAD-dependent protein deacetylase [Trebonia sp.]|nr:Sir2 family NAD-dependent protein deacetylase [Trebonia sp.]
MFGQYLGRLSGPAAAGVAAQAVRRVLHHRGVAHAGPAGQQAEVELRDGTFGSLVKILGNGGAVVLSGAGLSTESGIPDYRGPSGQARRAQPMTYQAFTGSGQSRQRYWARSHLGWRHITGAAPNAGHRAVAELERRGLVPAIITQNVDGLHQAAGAVAVTELHGSLHRVVCLGCWQRTSRRSLDTRLRAANPSWGFGRGPLLPPGQEEDGAEPDRPAVNPDGDVALDDTDGFAVVDCVTCGGMLKPDVVFFGENVPRTRVDECYQLVAGASSLVVLGSSLTVFSGLRYVRHAAKLGIPVVIVNQGPTRGDDLAAIRLDAPLGQTLSAAVQALS